MSVLVTLEKWSADYDAALPSQEPRGRKAAAYEAHGAQSFAAPSAPSATPIADMVEAMLSGGSPVEVVVLAVRTAELARGGTDPVADHLALRGWNPFEKGPLP
jgi:hypothetical protein